MRESNHKRVTNASIVVVEDIGKIISRLKVSFIIILVTFSDHDWTRTATRGRTLGEGFTQVAVSRSEKRLYRIMTSLPGGLF